MNTSILIVEDDKALQEYLRSLLSKEGYLPTVTSDGTNALTFVTKTKPDLVLLDLGLPTVKGDSVCREIKELYPEIPIIILTGKDTPADVVRGLSLGADDYVTKPFDAQVLLARIKARLRLPAKEGGEYVVDDLYLNTSTVNVRRGNKAISLTPQEFKILEYLMANKGRVLTREMMLSRLWGANPDIETRVIDVYIGYLRKKIDAGFKKKLIQSVRGFGYKMEG
jgi:DNA-binding response OmpR family regulator